MQTNAALPPAREPHADNDFEVFLDPSGSTQYYLEYEMNALNATYDIKWVSATIVLLSQSAARRSYAIICII
jgi:hypothetical protein|eukprot:COSAG06_NODE_12253_length_1403_cov_1.562117_3_plen_72_part_00